MGNYNCQECINKEVNVLNELLLENNIFSNDSISHDNVNSSHSSRKKYIKENREQIKKALENSNLSEEQKSYVQKMINENSSDYLETELDNAIKLRVGQRNIIEDNNNMNANDKDISEEQKKIIETQKEKILEQQRIIEEYKRQHLILQQQQNLLKEEEERLKMQIEKKNNQIQEEEGYGVEGEQSPNNEGIKIITLEPPASSNINEEKEENNEQIIIKQEEESEKNENVENSPQNTDILRQNIHPKNINQEQQQVQIEEKEPENEQKEEQEEQDEEPEDGVEDEQGEEQEQEQDQEQEQEAINNNFQQKNINMNINLENFPKSGGQIPPEQNNERNGLGNILAQLPQSQRFKIETYEPVEQEQKNGYENENNNYNDEVNENNDFNDEEDEE